MRSGTTVAAEKVKKSATPYVPVHYCDYDETFAANAVNVTSRVVEVESWEEKYSTRAIITLNNSDGGLDGLDLRRHWFRIGRGFTVGGGDYLPTSSGNIYPPTVQCYHQQNLSYEGRVLVRLYCDGLWDRAGRWQVDDGAGYIFNATDGLHTAVGGTLYIDDIIAWLFESTRANVPIGSTISAGGWYTSRAPALCIEPGENARAITRWLLGRTTGTDMLARASADPTGALHPVLYNTGSTMTYYTVYTTDQHTCKLAAASKQMYWPAKVTVVQYDEDGAVLYTGTYTDTGIWVAGMGQLTVVDDIKVCGSNADCVSLATTIVTRAGLEAQLALVELPIADPLVEVYDRVTVVDDRGDAAVSNAAIGGIYFHYKRGGNEPTVYSMRLYCGVVTATGEPNDNLDNYEGEGNLSDKRQHQYLPYREIDPKWITDAMQPFTVDIVWSSTARGNVTWTCATPAIRFLDGGTHNLSSSSYSIVDDNVHYFYFDLDLGGVQHTTSFADVMAADRGLLAVAVRGAADDTKCMILPNNGKVPILNANILYADIIKSAHIDSGQITTDHLESGVTARMFTDATAKSDIEGWRSATPSLIDGADILAGSVVINKLASLPMELMDGVRSSFEDWTTTPGCPNGWTVMTGSATRWVRASGAPKHGLYYARVSGASAAAVIYWSTRIYCDANDLITITSWMTWDTSGSGAGYLGFYCWDKNGSYLGFKEGGWAYTDFSSGVFAEKSVTLQPLSGTYFITPYVGISAAVTGGYWYFDDVRAIRANQIVLHGTIGGTSIKLSGAGIEVWGTDQMSMYSSGGVLTGGL